MVEAYDRYNSTILSVLRSKDPEDAKKFGFVAGKELEEDIMLVSGTVEKPGIGKAPSDLYIIGGLVFTPDIFEAIEEATRRIKDSGEVREIVYVDALNVLLEQGRVMYAKEIVSGVFRDTGNKLAHWLKWLVRAKILVRSLRPT
mgnify:CR=1 FL=1